MAYEVSVKSHVTAPHPLIACDPYGFKLDAILSAAKAADVIFYPGYNGGPMFLQSPEVERDRTALFGLLSEAGVRAWEHNDA